MKIKVKNHSGSSARGPIMGNEYLLDFLKITGWTSPTRLWLQRVKKLIKTLHSWVQQRHSCARLMGTLENLHLRSDTSCLNVKNDSHKESKLVTTGEQHGAKCRVVGSWWGTTTVSLTTYLSDSAPGKLEVNEEMIKRNLPTLESCIIWKALSHHCVSCCFLLFWLNTFFADRVTSLSSDPCSDLLQSKSLATAWSFLCGGSEGQIKNVYVRL